MTDPNPKPDLPLHKPWPNTKPPRKPKAFRVGPARVYAVKGPREDFRFYFQALRSVNGKRETIWTGWGNIPEATRAVAQVVATLTDPPENPGLSIPDSTPSRPDPSRYTVADLLDDWLAFSAARSDLREWSMISYRTAADRLTTRLGGYLVREITITHTQAYLNRRVGEGLAPATVANELNILRVAWRWGARARKHGEPEAIHTPRLKLNRTPKPRPTLTEAWQVYDAFPKIRAPEWARRAFALGLFTGARTSEIHLFTVASVDLEAGTIAVPAEGKTGARTVHLMPSAVDVIRPWVVGRHRDARLVGEIARGTLVGTLGEKIRRACRKANVTEFTCYGLRRLMTDSYIDAGLPAEIEAAQMGHSPEVAAKIYRLVRAARVSAAVLGAGIGSRPTPPPEGIVIPFPAKRPA